MIVYRQSVAFENIAVGELFRLDTSRVYIKIEDIKGSESAVCLQNGKEIVVKGTCPTYPLTGYFVEAERLPNGRN